MASARASKGKAGTSEDDERLELARFLPYQLSVVAENVSRVFARRYAQTFGLTVPEWRVMAVLAEMGDIATQDIIERTQMDPVRVSRAAIRLTDKGFVARRVHPEDQRAYVMRLSPKGVEVYRQIVPLARALEAELTESLTPVERQRLEEILAKIHAHARVLNED